MNTKKAIVGLLFVSPFIVGFVFFFVPIMFNAFRFSVSKIVMDGNGYSLDFVGLQHYAYILMKDPRFVRNLSDSVVALLQSMIVIISVSFFFSILLNQTFKGRAIFRAIFFLPIVLSAGVMSLIDDPTISANAVSGLNITEFMMTMGMPAGISLNISTIVSNLFITINASGVQILVFLAALQTISPSLYEASHMEGATAWENFWKITFPMLSPYILTCTVYTITDFAYQRQNAVMKQIVSIATSGSANDLSLSIAMALVMFAITIVLMLIVSVAISRMVFYYD